MFLLKCTLCGFISLYFTSRGFCAGDILCKLCGAAPLWPESLFQAHFTSDGKQHFSRNETPNEPPLISILLKRSIQIILTFLQYIYSRKESELLSSAFQPGRCYFWVLIRLLETIEAPDTELMKMMSRVPQLLVRAGSIRPHSFSQPKLMLS